MNKAFFQIAKPRLAGTEEALSFFRSVLGCEMHEAFCAAFLDEKAVLQYMIMFYGDQNRVEIDSRRLVGLAAADGCSGLVVAHNHPSGNAKPSLLDQLMTKKLSLGLEALDVTLLDHIIVCSDSHFSFRQHGLL